MEGQGNHRHQDHENPSNGFSVMTIYDCSDRQF